MAITRKDDFVSRAEGEWRNSPEENTILFLRLSREIAK
jgi:hypothetical protein